MKHEVRIRRSLVLGTLVLVFVVLALRAAPQRETTPTAPAPLPDTQSALPATGPVEPSAMSQATSWETFIRRNGPNWELEIDDRTGLPLKLRRTVAAGTGAAPVSTITPELRQTATRDLAETAGLLRIRPEELRLDEERVLRGKRARFDFSQHFRGVPVRRSRVTVDLDGNGELLAIEARYFADIDLESVAPRVSREEAEATARAEYLRHSGETGEVRGSELVILPELLPRQFFLAWEIDIQGSQLSSPWRYYVDALSGSLLYGVEQAVRGGAPAQRIDPIPTIQQMDPGLAYAGQVPHTIEARPTSAVRPADPAAPRPLEVVPDDGAEKGPLATPKTWNTLLSETFEGAFPSGNGWQLLQGSNGYTWDDDDYRPYTGSWSGWCADGSYGSGADLDPQTANYPNNMWAWMIYGPVDLSEATDAGVLFYYWNDSETNYDYLKWMASTNGTNFYGWQVSGYSGGWVSESFDLTSVPTLGNLAGRPQVWIAFLFTSDGSITRNGAFVDNIQLRRQIKPNLRPYAPSGWDGAVVAASRTGTTTSDNLGLETARKRHTTILASDGGGRLEAEGDPKRDWGRHTYRVLNVIDNQVRSLRKRQLIGSFTAAPGDAIHRRGTYWSIPTNIADYGLADPLPCPFERTQALAETPTRLKQLDDDVQERLVMGVQPTRS